MAISRKDFDRSVRGSVLTDVEGKRWTVIRVGKGLSGPKFIVNCNGSTEAIQWFCFNASSEGIVDDDEFSLIDELNHADAAIVHPN